MQKVMCLHCSWKKRGPVLTENVAILTMIADNYSPLGVSGPLGRYRLLETLAYISTEIHKSFKPLFTPGVSDDDKGKAIAGIEAKLQFIATQFKGDYLFGDGISVADAYLFVMLQWSQNNGIKMPNVLEAFLERMRARPSVVAAMTYEGLL